MARNIDAVLPRTAPEDPPKDQHRVRDAGPGHGGVELASGERHAGEDRAHREHVAVAFEEPAQRRRLH